MKMVLVVCPEGRGEEFRSSIEKRGVHAYTELGHATGESGDRVYGVTGDDALNLLGETPVHDDLAPKLESDLIDETEQVSLPRSRVGSGDKIGCRQGEEVQQMAVNDVGVEKQLAQLLRRRRDRHTVDRIARFCRSHMVGTGADTADLR